MEFDADRYEIRLAGSAAFEETTRRFYVLGHVTNASYKNLRVGWNQSRELPVNFPGYMMSLDGRLSEANRTTIENGLGLETSGLFDTHPSHGDRIRAARRAADPGVFECNRPATELFANFEVPAKQVTMLHYADDLGIAPGLARLVKPRNEPSPEPVQIEASEAKVPPRRLKLKH